MITRTPLLPYEAGHLILRTVVAPEWLDHNGHMNVAAYLIAFDRACCEFSREAMIGPENIASSGHTIFVGQANVVYCREVHQENELFITTRVRELTKDRLHLMMSMHSRQPDGTIVLAAVCEELCVCVSMATRRPASFPSEVAYFFKRHRDFDATLPAPRITTGAISLAPRTRMKES